MTRSADTCSKRQLVALRNFSLSRLILYGNNRAPSLFRGWKIARPLVRRQQGETDENTRQDW